MAAIPAAEAGGADVAKFLDLIAWSEGTSDSPVTRDDGYDVVVTGIDGPEIFTDFSDHPFAKGRPSVVVRREPLLTSTAAGRYQLMLRWWRAYQEMLGLKDFSPLSQDKVALRQMKERHAIAAVLAGDIAEAIMDCSNIWASFPGNDYAQAGGKTLEDLMAQWGKLP